MKKVRRAEINHGLEALVFVFNPLDKKPYLEFEANNSRERGLFPLPPRWIREGHLFLGYYKNSGIVAALLTHVRGKSLVLRRDSSLREYKNIHAALTWEAVKWAKAAGYREFDQGGYNMKLHPGVSLYKSEYGGKRVIRKVP